MIERDRVVKRKSEEFNCDIVRIEEDLKCGCAELGCLKRLNYKIKIWFKSRRLRYLKHNMRAILERIKINYDRRIGRIEKKINNIRALGGKNISYDLRRVDELRDVIEKEKCLIYGAIGETEVINELKKLPDSYQIINNFKKDFQPPIYNRTEHDRIHSIQADHLVVGPTGIFVIETKYWSNQSILNEALFSPVKQVKRIGFALFVMLNSAIKKGYIVRLVNNWGERKISLKQVVVSVNNTPHREFQYVKVFGIEKLNSYITYGNQEFTKEEVRDIVNYLLQDTSMKVT